MAINKEIMKNLDILLRENRIGFKSEQIPMDDRVDIGVPEGRTNDFHAYAVYLFRLDRDGDRSYRRSLRVCVTRPNRPAIAMVIYSILKDAEKIRKYKNVAEWKVDQPKATKHAWDTFWTSYHGILFILGKELYEEVSALILKEV